MDDSTPDDPPGSTMAGTGSDGPSDDRVNVGVLVADSPRGDHDRLYAFARRAARDAAAELQSATAVSWRFVSEEPTPLPDGEPRRPSEFLDDAMDRIADGPYDVIVVVTDVPLRSRSGRFVAGLSSGVSRVVVASTRRLSTAARDGAARSLDSAAVRWNGAALLLHLLGHVLGADHGESGAMAPFEFDPSRRSAPAFDADVEEHLRRVAEGIPAESVSRGPLGRIAFYVESGVRNSGQIASALVHSRAVTLPLALPKLATAAIAPTLVILFSAESWDVGLHLGNRTAALFAVGSVLVAAVHLLFVQDLFFPRRRQRRVTEHMALVNVTVFLILIAAMVGLFALVASVMLAIEFLVFPPELMANWPSLEDPNVDLIDRIRTAGFIATIGMLSGALAGGLEDRSVLRHLALFRKRP